MKKIRDFFYNSSDIFVTLLVLALAAGIIFWRVQKVMGYTEYAVAKSGTETKIDIDFSDVNLEPEKEEDPEPVADPDVDPETDPGKEEPPEIAGPGDADYKTPKAVKVEIPKGCACAKAGRIVAEKLGYTDAQSKEFVTAFVNTADKLGYHIRYGTYEIPAGSTMEKVIRILTCKD